MKKIILATLLLAVMGTLAFAAPNFPRENDNKAGFSNTAITGGGVDVASYTKPATVYGLTAYAETANTRCDIYDASTTPVNGTKPKIEAATATQYTSVHFQYDPPVNFTTGIYIDATAGSCIVEYR